jgi:hypothetical protein
MPMPAAAPVDRPSAVKVAFEDVEDVGVGAPINELVGSIFDDADDVFEAIFNDADDVVEMDQIMGVVILISSSL